MDSERHRFKSFLHSLPSRASVFVPGGEGGGGGRVNWLKGFLPDSSVHKDLGSIPGLGRYPGEGKGYPLQYSGLENFMDYIKSMRLQRVRYD